MTGHHGLENETNGATSNASVHGGSDCYATFAINNASSHVAKSSLSRLISSAVSKADANVSNGNGKLVSASRRNQHTGRVCSDSYHDRKQGLSAQALQLNQIAASLLHHKQLTMEALKSRIKRALVICDCAVATVFLLSMRRVWLRESRPSSSRARVSAHADWRHRRGGQSSRDIETRSFPNLLVATLATLPSMALIPSVPFPICGDD